MQNQTFRYGKFQKYSYAFLFLFYALYLLPSLIVLIEPASFLDRLAVWNFTFWGVAGFILLVGIVLIPIFLSLGVFRYFLTYQILLSDTSLRIQAFDFWSRNFYHNINHFYFIGEIPYNDIQQIEVDSWRPGAAKISLKEGKHIYLNIRGLEGNSEFMRQLTSHLSPEQMGEGLDILGKPRRFRILISFIYIVALVPTFLIMLNRPVIDLLKSMVWNEELGSWSVGGISVDPDNSVWVGVHHYEGDTFAWHISQNARDHWTLPKDLCPECSLLVSISHDAHGYPRIVHWVRSASNNSTTQSTILAWDGSRWLRTTTDISFYNENLHAYNTDLWGERDGNLVRWDFATDKSEEIPSPPEVITSKLRLLNFKVNTDGSILARFSEKNKPEMLYRLRDGQWQPILSISDSAFRIDFCQDNRGTVWVLKWKRRGQSMLGYYDIEKQDWVWHDLTSLYAYPVEFLLDIAVDPLGRIWISGSYEDNEALPRYTNFVKVFSWSENRPIQIEEYTRQNSNIKYSSYLTVTPNGRVWLHENDLFWLDGTSEHLPAPLPDWINNLDLYEHFGLFIPVFVAQMILFGIAWALEYK